MTKVTQVHGPQVPSHRWRVVIIEMIRAENPKAELSSRHGMEGERWEPRHHHSSLP